VTKKLTIPSPNLSTLVMPIARGKERARQRFEQAVAERLDGGNWLDHTAGP
jgi:hypothetical protein